MPDLHSLLSAAIDDVNFLESHLELLEIAIEQLETSDDELCLRSSLALINVFLAHAQYHYRELQDYLNRAIEVSSND